MKLNRLFWCTLLGSLALVVLGYVGFLVSMPDKTSGHLVPVFLLCLLLLSVGVLGLVAALVCAVARAVSGRKRTKGEAV